jgi:glycosyltransferase involved in cell wall biosynthesis
MCTHNSAKMLPIVLPQIEKVIPKEAINNKFIVDDFSIDNTKEIAESLGWTVYCSLKHGLVNTQAQAFSLVKTEYCAVFEHDLFLSSNWFPKIPNLIINEEYSSAQGIRLRNVAGFREADLHQYTNYYSPSEDNNFFNMRKPDKNRFIDNTIVSKHLRKGIVNCLRHDYFFDATYGAGSFNSFFKCLIKSPFLSLKIFKETGSKAVLFCYPMERLFIFLGWLMK